MQAALVAAALFGCGERVEAGLANAPSLERKSEPRSQYDVVSTGPEGCTSTNGGASVASAAGGCKQNSTGPAPVADSGSASTPQ
jgi:hypothetical protein